MQDQSRARRWVLNPSRQAYPRNQWYVAALSNELSAKPLARKILDTDVVLYRIADGSAVALYDRCPHRSLPLSMGAVSGDHIRCAYHGMQFDARGNCVAIPSQNNIPCGLLQAKTFPLVERAVWIWIWMGDPELADPALIPDHQYLYLDAEGFDPVPLFSMRINCNYQLCHENLLDLTHLTFLHEGAFESGGMTILDVPNKLTTSSERVRLSYLFEGLVVDDAYSSISGFPVGSVIDRTLVTEALPPCIGFIYNSYVAHGKDEQVPLIWSTPFAMTPRDASSTNYFFVSSANYHIPYTEEAKAQMAATFAEDKEALEAIQLAFESSSADLEYEFSVKADTGALRLRRIIHDMARREIGSTVEPVAQA